MGNDAHLHSNFTAWPSVNNYELLQRPQYKVWRDIKTQTETYEEYDVRIQDETHLNQYKAMWLLRSNYQSFPKIHHFTHQVAPGLCSTYEGGSILSDRVAYRLQQFFEVKYTNILTIMSIALQSFQILHEEYGLFNVKRGMIGIAGNLTAPRVKVWCNQDFSNPQPQYPTCRNIRDMLMSIINEIELSGKAPEEYPTFGVVASLTGQRCLGSFGQLRNALETYLDMFKISISRDIQDLNGNLIESQRLLIDTVHLKMDRSLSKNKYSFKKRTASVDKQVIWRVSRDDVEDNSMAEESEKSRFSTPRLNRYGFGRLEQQPQKMWSSRKKDEIEPVQIKGSELNLNIKKGVNIYGVPLKQSLKSTTNSFNNTRPVSFSRDNTKLYSPRWNNSIKFCKKEYVQAPARQNSCLIEKKQEVFRSQIKVQEDGQSKIILLQKLLSPSKLSFLNEHPSELTS